MSPTRSTLRIDSLAYLESIFSQPIKSSVESDSTPNSLDSGKNDSQATPSSPPVVGDDSTKASKWATLSILNPTNSRLMLCKNPKIKRAMYYEGEGVTTIPVECSHGGREVGEAGGTLDPLRSVMLENHCK